MSDFITHIERYLGRIGHGWKSSYDGKPMPFQVVECHDGFVANTTSFLTIGLNKYELRSPVSEKIIGTYTVDVPTREM